MSRCILHIGMHKTGSTSIQKSLRGFSDDRFVYFEDHLNRANHGPALHALLDIKEPGSTPADFERAKRNLKKIVRRLGSRTLILCSERLFRFNRHQAEKLSTVLRGHGFDRIEVFGYIRAPGDYLSSVIQQRIKDGRKSSIDLRQTVEGRYPRFRDQIGLYDEVFGRENVHLRKFDPSTFPSGDVVHDFCDQAGIDLPSERVVRLNESVSREVIALIFTYHELHEGLGLAPLTAPQNRALVDRLRPLGSTRFRLSPDLVKPILERHRADIAWMEARLGQPLSVELGEHRAGDVRDENDLLKPDPQLVDRLKDIVQTPAGVRGDTPEDVVRLVHALRDEPESRQEPRPLQAASQKPAQPIRLEEILQGLAQDLAHDRQGAFAGITPDRLHRLVANAFSRINRKLETDGVVNVAGLGLFRVVGGASNRTQSNPRARGRQVVAFRPDGESSEPQ
jgi:hypothetical protein